LGVFSHIVSWDALADAPINWDDIAERRMEPAVQPIHRLSQIWAQTECRGGIPRALPAATKLHRVMMEGPNAAAYSGPASPATWGVEMEIFEHCFRLLPEYEYQQYFLSHYCDMPGSYPTAERRRHLAEKYRLKSGSDDTYQRRMNAIRKSLLRQYTDIWDGNGLTEIVSEHQRYRIEQSETAFASRAALQKKVDALKRQTYG
jgi:hypothetical protein